MADPDDIDSRSKGKGKGKAKLPQEKLPQETQPQEKPFEIHTTTNIATFLNRFNISVLATAYKANQVFSFGTTDSGKLGCFYATHNHPMALGLSPRRDCTEVWLATKLHLVRCSDAGGQYNAGSDQAGGDGDFSHTLVPRQLYAIGDQFVHGIYVTDPAAPPDYLSTQFSALCQLQTDTPEINVFAKWKPPFISQIKGEDRCHLNDVCYVNGKPKFASCMCESDAHDGWRDHRASGGIIIDVETDKIVARGLSMPHSPRWYKNALWVLNSGTGELGTVNLDTGTFEAKVFLPGFLRGLQFVDRFAVVGSSLDRHQDRFMGLELGKTLDAKKTTPVCGFFVVDLVSFTIVHKVEIKYGGVHELYDILLVPGKRVRMVGLNDEDGANMTNVRTAFDISVPAGDDTRLEDADELDE